MQMTFWLAPFANARLRQWNLPGYILDLEENVAEKAGDTGTDSTLHDFEASLIL